MLSIDAQAWLQSISLSVKTTTTAIYTSDGLEAISKLAILIPDQPFGNIDGVLIKHTFKPLKELLVKTKLAVTLGSYVDPQGVLKLPHRQPPTAGEEAPLDWATMLITVTQTYDALYFFKTYLGVDVAKIFEPLVSYCQKTDVWSFCADCLDKLGQCRIYKDTTIADIVAKKPEVLDVPSFCVMTAFSLNAILALQKGVRDFQKDNLSVQTQIANCAECSLNVTKNIGKVLLIANRHLQNTNTFFYGEVVTNLAVFASLVLKANRS